MGITSFSIELIERNKGNAKTVIELGAQNLYNQPMLPAPYANEWYESQGIEYACIDVSKENNCIEIDLSKPYTGTDFCRFDREDETIESFDLVTDFGTSEHVGNDGVHDPEAFYNCWKIKHDLLKEGGVMINENPKTGNWPGHGFNYVTSAFYLELAQLCGYAVLEIGEHPAMGNITDGWNVYCVLRKSSNADFISFEDFKTLPFYNS
jgi:hypothetical protein